MLNITKCRSILTLRLLVFMTAYYLQKRRIAMCFNVLQPGNKSGALQCASARKQKKMTFFMSKCYTNPLGFQNNPSILSKQFFHIFRTSSVRVSSKADTPSSFNYDLVLMLCSNYLAI